MMTTELCICPFCMSTVHSDKHGAFCEQCDHYYPWNELLKYDDIEDSDYDFDDSWYPDSDIDGDTSV